MARLFFLVSGENPTIPFSEIRSILKAEGFTYIEREKYTQILRLQANPKCIRTIKQRSAMTKVCGIELFNCEAEKKEILNNVRDVDVASHLSLDDNFAVRVKRVQRSSPMIDCLSLESHIGKVIQRNTKQRTKVNLKSPLNTFFGILSDCRFIFGLKKAAIKAGVFNKRSSKEKIFTHSAAMPAKLARCMVNLAGPKVGSVILDPFCGTGSFLVEAGLLGYQVIGFDVKRSMIEGSFKNLNFYGIKPQCMAVADAKRLPLAKGKIDCVVTDPPYGTSTTTLGLENREVFETFLATIVRFIKTGGRICLAAPKKVEIKEIGEQTGFKYIESHLIYIHRSLTREIAVLELPR